MILQALNDYYETLNRNLDYTERLPAFGWSKTLVQFALFINSSGDLVQIVPLSDENNKSGLPQVVPLQLKRSGTKPPP